MTVSEVSKVLGMSISTTRRRLLSEGGMRSRKEAIRLAANKGRMRRYGERKPISEQGRINMRLGKAAYFKKHKPVGKSLKPSGYVEMTTGEHKFRPEHVVIIEQRLGRKLTSDECVHHIDHCKSNNTPDNLEIMTRSAHSRLHALENISRRKRNLKGQFI
jgi:hypothetical protein